MGLKVTNAGVSTLAASINTSVTSIAIAAGDASKFPTLSEGDWFPLTIVDSSGNFEIVKVTARSGATLTVVRAQEGTTARSFASGSKCDLRLSAAAISLIVQLASGDHTHEMAQINGLVAALADKTTDAELADAISNLANVYEAKSDFVTKSANYNAVAADKNDCLYFDGAYTLTTDAAATLGAGWKVSAIAGNGNVLIDPSGTQKINGQDTLILRSGQRCTIESTGTAFIATVGGNDPVAKWRNVGIGGYYIVDTSKTGVEIPPSSDPELVFIELTAGLTGSGAFNNGKLTTESVSGSAPLVLATAVVAVTGSTMNGQTVDLINTEARVLRPSASPGTKQNDALQDIDAQIDLAHTSGSSASGAFTATSISGSRNGSDNFATIRLAFAASRVARTASETRMKNVGVKAYMRVK